MLLNNSIFKSEGRPLSSVAPTISGSGVTGQVLSATTGSWSGGGGISGLSYTYQWRRGGVNITGGTATAYTYTLTTGDSFYAIDCVVSASNFGGGTPQSTNQTTPIRYVFINDVFDRAGLSPWVEHDPNNTLVVTVNNPFVTLSGGVYTIMSRNIYYGVPFGTTPLAYSWKSTVVFNLNSGDLGGGLSIGTYNNPANPWVFVGLRANVAGNNIVINSGDEGTNEDVAIARATSTGTTVISGNTDWTMTFERNYNGTGDSLYTGNLWQNSNTGNSLTVSWTETNSPSQNEYATTYPSIASTHSTAQIKSIIWEYLSSELEVQSANNISDIEVETGTTFGQLNLPSTANFELSNTNVVPLVIPSWNGSYNGNIEAIYTLTGSPTLIPGVLNSAGIVASLDVVVSGTPAPPPATSYDVYVSVTGSNGNNGLSIGQAKLGIPEGVTVAVGLGGSSGRSVHIATGTYTLTAYYLLPVNISLYGDGRDLTIISGITSLDHVFVPYNYAFDKSLLRLEYGDGGGQVIKDLQINGATNGGRGKFAGMHIWNRDNVIIDNCKFRLFGFSALQINNTSNVRITNCDFFNSAFGSDVFATGAVTWGGPLNTNLEIDNCTVDEDFGNGMKQFGSNPTNTSTITNFKFHDNYITVTPTGQWDGGSASNIAFELWGVVQINSDVYDNVIDNTVSLVLNQPPTDSVKTIRFHHNIVDIINNPEGKGYPIEVSINYCEIDNNWLNGGALATFANYQNLSWGPYTNWDIHHNTIVAPQHTYPSGIIRNANKGCHYVNFYNNTIHILSANNKTCNIIYIQAILADNTSNNINVRNNVIYDQSTADDWYENKIIRMSTADPFTSTINTSFVEYNSINGMPVGSVAGVTYNNNITTVPDLQLSGDKPDPYYRPIVGGNLDQKGTNVSLPFNGTGATIGSYEIGGNITGITAQADINTITGVTFLSLPLPTTVLCSLDNGQNTNFALVWSSVGYNKNVPNTYAISGTPTLASGITNTTPLYANVNVIVSGITGDITGISAQNDVNVGAGISFTGLTLPTTVLCFLDSGTTKNLAVTWSSAGYDENSDGVYPISGSPILASGITNTTPIYAYVNVNVNSAFIYVTTGGSDGGTGFQSSPYLTIKKATLVAVSGQTILISAGTYVETQHLLVPEGVNMTGAGTGATIIQGSAAIYYTYTAYSLDKFLIQLTASTLQDGNQTLKDFTADGVSRNIRGGIWVQHRRNVTIDNVSTIDFGGNAIWLNRVENAVLKNGYSTNSGWASVGYAIGNINISSITGLTIANYYINEDYGYGYGIKGLSPGGGGDHYHDIIMSGTTITVDPESIWNNGSSANIAFEVWANDSPLELDFYNNTFSNILSLVNNGGMPHSTATTAATVFIHDNFFDITRVSTSGGSQRGYGIELSLPSTHIYNNRFYKGGYAIVNWSPNTKWKYCKIYNNLFSDHHGFYPSGVINSYRGHVEKTDIINNTLHLNNTGTTTYNSGVTELSFFETNNGSDVWDTDIANNLIINSVGGNSNYFKREAATGTTFSGSTFRNNYAEDLNGGVGGPTTGVVYSNNFTGITGTADIQRSGNIPLPYYSPIVGGNLDQTGVDVGLPFNGTGASIGKYESVGGEITGISAQNNVDVGTGVTFTGLTLPSIVLCFLSTGQNANLSVVWSSAGYDENTPATYTLSGTPTLVSGITNTTPIYAYVDVVVSGVIIWTPEDLGIKLKIFTRFDDSSYMTVVATKVSQVDNIDDSGTTYWEQTGSTEQPVFNDTTDEIEMNSANRHMIFSDPTLVTGTGDTQGEWNIIGHRTSLTSRAYFVTLTDSASTDDRMRFTHWTAADRSPSGATGVAFDPTPTGTQDDIYFLDEDVNKPNLISIGSNGSEYIMYKNKGLQSLIVGGGANNGNWHGDILPDGLSMGASLASSPGYGNQNIRLIIYTDSQLTTQERSDLYNWAVTQGMLTGATGNITGISAQNDITGSTGVVFTGLTLPSTVLCFTNSGTSEYLSVVWSSAGYDENTPATYTLSGTPTLVSGITNTTPIYANIDVVVTGWTPSDLGSKLKIFNRFDDAAYLTLVSTKISVADNIADSGTTYWTQATDARRPVFNSGATTAEFVQATNQWMDFSSYALVSGDTQGEWNFIFRRKNTTIRAQPVAFSLSSSSSASIMVPGHYTASDEGPSGGVQLRHADGASQYDNVSYDEAETDTYRLHSFGSSGTAYTIYKDKVSQTLDVPNGTNSGDWHGDTAFDQMFMGRRGGLTDYYSTMDLRLIIYTNVELTTQERLDLYDWAVVQGML